MGISTAGYIAIAASVAGAAASTYGSYQQAQASKSQANYQAQVAENNAQIARDNAARVRQDSQVAQDEQRERIQRTKGAAAAAASRGLIVDDTSDSSVQLNMQDIAGEGELDILRIRDRYEGEERRAIVQGINFTADVGLQRAKASSYSPLMAAGGTLLESASGVYSTGKSVGAWK